MGKDKPSQVENVVPGVSLEIGDPGTSKIDQSDVGARSLVGLDGLSPQPVAKPTETVPIPPPQEPAQTPSNDGATSDATSAESQVSSHVESKE